MAKRGKTIQVFLMDGEANGRIKATISNWNGLAYKIPREKLSACKEREDLSQSSVYFLFGSSDDGLRDLVYIGQAGVRKTGGGILIRLMEHDKNPEKDYWTEAVVFTTSDNTFGPSELSFLENRFCNMALAAERYDVKNAIEPTPGNLREEKVSELEEYADYAELILGVLGYKVFEPVTRSTYPVAQKLVTHKAEGEEKTAQDKQGSSATTKVPLPSLPDRSLKIGAYVRAAMTALSNSGYVFSDAAIDEMCTSEWTKKVFHSSHPFMRRYVKGETNNKDAAGYVRFWVTPFTYGQTTVLISKEWFDDQYGYFDTWYSTL